MSSSNKRVGGLNIMEVPRYDNGYGYAPVKAHSVPTRKADVHLIARSQSHKVTASNRQPVAPAPYVASVNIVKRKAVAQAPGAELYMNRPLPPLPGSAAAASRPQGITKPSTINTNKPLPPMPRPSLAPATNGIYTSTGQRITAPVETSAWSNTTESTRAIRRRQKRDKNLQSHSTTIMNAIPEARKTTFKAPELLKTHATVGKPGQDRGKVQDSRWAATQAACRYTHRQEAQMAQDRMAAARRVIVPSSSTRGGAMIHKDTMKTREWKALSPEERSRVTRQYEIDVERMRRGSVGRGGGYVAPNAAAATPGKRNGRKNSSKCSVM